MELSLTKAILTWEGLVMDASYTGWVDLPIHMQPDVCEQILRSRLSEPTLRHAAEIAILGYTVIPKVFSLAECRSAISEIESLTVRNAHIFDQYRDGRGILPRLTNLHMAVPSLSRFFTRNSVLLEVQDFFFRRQTSLYSSLYYQHGSEQPPHRDTPVFCTRPEYNYFGNTVYLEAAGDDNGCLEVIPGGHLVGEMDREAIALSRYNTLEDVPQLGGELWNDYQKKVMDRCNARGYSIKKLHVNPGDCVIWHPQLPHGGSVIKDTKLTRHSFVFHTAPVGARVYHQHVFFHPSKAYPEMAEWDQSVIDGRVVVHHDQGIAFGHPINKGINMTELDLSGLTAVESMRVTTAEALAIAAGELTQNG